MTRQVPWLRISVEGVVVVASILLAFAIDRWWEGHRAREVEQEVLDVLSRDLAATIDQLEEFAEHADGVAAASFAAYTRLSAPVPEEERSSVSLEIRTAFRRKTMNLPRAGYADLLSAGTLGHIRSGPLRESIIRFYDLLEHIEASNEKNSTLYTDEFMGTVFTVGGLLLRMPDGDPSFGGRGENRIPPNFEHRPDPLWDFDVDSPEWNRARSVLLQNGRGSEASLERSYELVDAARSLQEAVRAYVAQEH